MTMRNESSFVPFLAGFGAGALFAALLDPRRGAGRRALIRDKALSLVRQAGVTAARQGRDLKQRAQGMAHEMSVRLEKERPSDDVLAERVRAQIGRPVSHPRSIEMRVEGGEVILSGPIADSGLTSVLGSSPTGRETSHPNQNEQKLDVGHEKEHQHELDIEHEKEHQHEHG